jgi:SpoVK/Ycf46/Vps4 family AAA+-type ATPase
MARQGKPNVDYLTYYRDPAEASPAELHTARWAVQLFRASAGKKSSHPRFGQPIEELLEVGGRLLVWSRPLLEAINQANDGAPLPADSPLDKARMCDLPLATLAEGDSEILNRSFRHVLKQPRWRVRLARDSLAWINRALPAAQVPPGNADWLADGLGMAPFDRELLKLTLLRYEWRKVGDFLTQLNLGSMREAARLIAAALDVEERVVRASLGRDAPLLRYGILDPSEPMTDLGDLLRLSPHFTDALTQRHEDAAALFRYMLQEAPPSTLGREDYAHLAGELDAARRLIANARGERGVNILLYGRPGTGKTQFARLLGREVGATVYETPCEDRDGESIATAGRLRQLRFAERIVGGRDDVLVLFDEAEDAFPAGRQYLHFAGMGPGLRQYSKAWMNNILESNRVPVVWLTNRIDEMEPAYLRRFTLHVEFREPARSVRHEIATRYLAPAGISPATIARVAEEEDLAPAQLETAARYLKLCRASAPAEAERLFERQFRAARKAMGLGGLLKRPAQPLAYDARFVNLAGELGVERLVAALGKRGAGSLCLWGPPGTGKTELAHHLARTLDRELVVKTGGDLLHPYVGMTEMLIRRMFEDAAAQEGKCVLLLDEADTFLRDRSKARERWEASFTNEFLRQMENFPGIFVCATNLFGELDRAVLRRFQFRLEFKPLAIAQRIALFEHTFSLAPGAATGAALERLDGLVPADFANVARQLALLELEADEARVLGMLETELRTRLAEGADGKRMGFV